MKKFELLAASAIALIAATPAMAQNTPAPAPATPAPQATSDQDNGATAGYGQDIVITAQRQSERLQDVPIAVSAFTGAALEKQQIVNPSSLQLTLPSITYTKTNFTSSSFTIRGIGDLCVGATCDSATAIHVNDMPLTSTRLFESEFYDLERVEVLRGPQGTLFGRNATSGVVNFITAKPDLSKVGAAGEVEYGNYNSKKVKGMFNLPITHTLGVRVAGLYLNRDGYTYNEFTKNKVDDRDLWSIRGTLSWEPDSNTRVDLIGYYFREKDHRARIQKQLCHRDPTGVLGCLPDRLGSSPANGLSTLAAVLSSKEFFYINGYSGGFAAAKKLGASDIVANAVGISQGNSLANFGLQSLYNTAADPYAGVTTPGNVRTISADVDPTYFAEEEQYTLKVMHDFGPVVFNFTGGYARNSVDSTSDYNLAAENPLVNNPGLFALYGASQPGGPATWLAGVRNALIPKGPNGGICQSSSDVNNVGVYGGNTVGCFPESLDFDRSRSMTRQYTAEAHIDSHFDGMFNFLLGGIYVDSKTQNTDYFVNAFGLDYASGILGAASSQSIPGVAGNAFLATPFYRNDGDEFRLKSYGIFGETYFAFTNKLKLTLGLRYNHDSKYDKARNLTLNILTPIGSDNMNQDGLNTAAVDFDPTKAGVQNYAIDRVAFTRLTGRAVIDYKITPNNLLYASYSRGYKSGGINPPLPPTFNVPTTFNPEKVDAFEIGSKNTFGGGALRLNLTAFYYKYDDLQLSRIVARTSVNDNVSADIYGVEAEAIISPVPAFVINANFSYLKTKVSSDKFLVNPRDVSGGRSDAVIIKDVTNGSNCVVIPTGPGGAALSNGYVAAVNANPALNLKAPVAIPGMNGTTGAYGVCSALQASAAPSGVTVLDGVPVNIRGNKLPGAPTYKASVGAQYTIDLGGMSLVPRADLAYTGNTYGSIFNGNVDRIQGYSIINAQIQLNGRDDKWYLRAFVQNLTNNNAITGQYVTDQSSGLFTNIFTLDPRRFGVAAGFKF
jgi:iron complex outermembrane receptor protein